MVLHDKMTELSNSNQKLGLGQKGIFVHVPRYPNHQILYICANLQSERATGDFAAFGMTKSELSEGRRETEKQRLRREEEERKGEVQKRRELNPGRLATKLPFSSPKFKACFRNFPFAIDVGMLGDIYPFGCSLPSTSILLHKYLKSPRRT